MSGGEERVTLTGAVRALDPARELRWHGRFQVRLLAYLLLFSLAISLTAGYIYYTRQVKFVEAEQKKRGRTLISNLAGQSELGARLPHDGRVPAALRRGRSDGLLRPLGAGGQGRRERGCREERRGKARQLV